MERQPSAASVPAALRNPSPPHGRFPIKSSFCPSLFKMALGHLQPKSLRSSILSCAPRPEEGAGRGPGSRPTSSLPPPPPPEKAARMETLLGTLLHACDPERGFPCLGSHPLSHTLVHSGGCLSHDAKPRASHPCSDPAGTHGHSRDPSAGLRPAIPSLPAALFPLPGAWPPAHPPGRPGTSLQSPRPPAGRKPPATRHPRRSRASRPLPLPGSVSSKVALSWI